MIIKIDGYDFFFKKYKSNKNGILKEYQFFADGQLKQIDISKLKEFLRYSINLYYDDNNSMDDLIHIINDNFEVISLSIHNKYNYSIIVNLLINNVNKDHYKELHNVINEYIQTIKHKNNNYFMLLYIYKFLVNFGKKPIILEEDIEYFTLYDYIFDNNIN